MGLVTHSWCTLQHSVVSTLQCSILHYWILLAWTALHCILPYPTLPFLFISLRLALHFTPLLIILSSPLTESMTHIYHLQSLSVDCLPYRHVKPKINYSDIHWKFYEPFSFLKWYFIKIGVKENFFFSSHFYILPVSLSSTLCCSTVQIR